MKLILEQLKIVFLLFFKALEQELSPVEERLRRLAVMAQKLSGSSGSDARHISNRKAEMSALWDGLKVCTTQGGRELGQLVVFMLERDTFHSGISILWPCLPTFEEIDFSSLSPIEC